LVAAGINPPETMKINDRIEEVQRRGSKVRTIAP
jgi:hypothetical protein